MQQINTMAKSGEKRQLKKKRGFRLREEQMFVALYRASVANWKTKNKTHPDIGCSKTLIQKKRQFILGLIKCLFRRVTEDESCKSSVKTKQLFSFHGMYLLLYSHIPWKCPRWRHEMVNTLNEP